MFQHKQWVTAFKHTQLQQPFSSQHRLITWPITPLQCACLYHTFFSTPPSDNVTLTILNMCERQTCTCVFNQLPASVLEKWWWWGGEGSTMILNLLVILLQDQTCTAWNSRKLEANFTLQSSRNKDYMDSHSFIILIHHIVNRFKSYCDSYMIEKV